MDRSLDRRSQMLAGALVLTPPALVARVAPAASRAPALVVGATLSPG